MTESIDKIDENMTECMECGESLADCICNIEDELRDDEEEDYVE